MDPARKFVAQLKWPPVPLVTKLRRVTSVHADNIQEMRRCCPIVHIAPCEPIDGQGLVGRPWRLPLVAAWVCGFMLQAVVRANISGTPFFVPLMPMTSAAFIILTLIPPPRPSDRRGKPCLVSPWRLSTAPCN